MTTLNEFLKTDIAFTDDFKLSASNDFDTVTGMANLKEAIFRRIMTVKGSLIHRPDYGVGLPEFQNAPATLHLKGQLFTRLQEQLPRDPRIEAVTSLSVDFSDTDPSRHTIKIGVSVAGFGAVVLEYTPFNEVI